MKIKTRFAPSPTGFLHIGSVRTALYSWLFARQNNGKFVMRIEDTDVERSTSESVEAIICGMNWLNLNWDEGPYFQTKRLNRYNLVLNEMLEAGTAYKCYCSKERLDNIREEQIVNGKKPRYDSYCRYNHRKHIANKPYVVRFANPNDGFIIFNDQIRGPIKFNNKELDDFIIRRTNGTLTYNFCTVVDDWDMKITHVIRGEDHINNTPRQINILKALNAPIPVYAHVSVINGEDGKKLSKRHGAINIMQYRDDGYLPEALLNYLVRLGWSNGNQEIFSREDMIRLFSLDNMSKSASTFNINKLLWLNQYYINAMSREYVATCLKWQIEQAKININNGPKLVDLIKLLGKRCKTLKEIVENCRYFYEEFDIFNENLFNKYLSLTSRIPLEFIRDKLVAINEWRPEDIYLAIREASDKLKVRMGEIGMPLRIAVTGSNQSPEIHLTVYAIGKKRSIARINKALDFISKYKN